MSGSGVYCLHYIVGVDIGLTMEPTALAVVEQESRRMKSGTECTALRLRHLERLPLDAGYPQLVERVKETFDKLKDDEGSYETDLLVDVTGVGRAVAPLMKKAELRPILVTISGGTEEIETAPADWKVPKTELIGNLQVAFQTAKLKAARSLELVPTFIEELENFKMKPPTLRPDDFESWREGNHDDLIFAVGLCVWHANKNTPYPRAGWGRERYEEKRQPGSAWAA